MGQIEGFVKAAESEFGMKPTETFQPNDLYEGIKGNMINVRLLILLNSKLNCIAYLISDWITIAYSYCPSVLFVFQIINTLHELGLRANKRGFNPQYAGSGKMADENVRGFTEEEIKKASAKAIPKVAAGSHGGATQSGMSFGTTRKI